MRYYIQNALGYVVLIRYSNKFLVLEAVIGLYASIFSLYENVASLSWFLIL
jgi:hypothetical protein